MPSVEQPSERTFLLLFCFSAELRPFDASLLCPVAEVRVPSVDVDDPPFTAEPGWLEETERMVLKRSP